MREGWVKRKLGDVFTLEYGKPLPKDQRCEETGFPAYGANGIKCYAVKPYMEGPSIIVGRKGTAGAVNIVGSAFWPLDVTYYVTFDESEYDLRFLYYVLSSLDLPSLATGVKPGINRNIVYSIERAFPPLVEQKRIVAILDEAFEGIDAAIANTEKNLANARELFESYLNFMFNPRGEGWIEKPLAEFVTSISTGPFGSLLHKSDYVSDGVPLVNPINIVGSKVIPDNKKMVGDDTKERLGAYILKAGDIALARRGEIGRCAVIENAQDGWVCGTGCFFIRPGKHVNPHFMGHLLRSTRYRKELERISSGATMLNLSNKALSGLMVVLPEIREQERLMNRISELLAQCQKVEDIYRQKLEVLAELKQSLLQKAFTGELTAENMDNEAREAVI